MKESEGSKYRNSIPNTYCSSVLSCNTSLHLRTEQSYPQSPYRVFSNQTHIIRENKNITPDMWLKKLCTYTSSPHPQTFNGWALCCAITALSCREVHFNSPTEKPSTLNLRSPWWGETHRQWAPYWSCTEIQLVIVIAHPTKVMHN